MQLRLLFDEDTEREIATKLQHAGHDVERVVEVKELGTGTTDEDIREYACRTNRIIVTHDDDHLAAPSNSHDGVFYVSNQRLTAFRLFRIVQKVFETYPDREAMPAVVFLTNDWLE